MDRDSLPLSVDQRIESLTLNDLGDTSTSQSAYDDPDKALLQNTQPEFGIPRRKRLLETVDLLALGISLLCAAAATCVVSPQLAISWYLGSNNQIVVLGFLLGMMAQCTHTILPTTMLVLEARFGSSRLQNYEAILRGRLTSSHTSFVWRVALALMAALPLGLGVAYKRFLGGQTIVAVQATGFEGTKYGLSYPPLGDLATMNMSIYSQINVNADFYAHSANDSRAPSAKDYPLALGYNMVLLEENAAAILDMQTPEYLTWIQSNLRSNESWTISATVNSIVARRNQQLEKSVKAEPSNIVTNNKIEEMDSYWVWVNSQPICISTITIGGNAYMIGLHNDTYWAALGLYFRNLTGPAFAESFALFRQSALIFNLTREICTGKWLVTNEQVSLIDGKCNASSASQTSQNLFKPNKDGFHMSAPFYTDTLPVVGYLLRVFESSRHSSPWRLPAYATSTASAWWARATFMLERGSGNELTFPDSLYYNVEDEHITSSIGTLRASWALMVILWTHPCIILVALLTGMLLYHTPLSQGFGLASILAGIVASGLHLLRGAALSGELSRPVNVGFHHEPRNSSNASSNHIRAQTLLKYSLHQGRVRAERLDLRPKQKYW